MAFLALGAVLSLSAVTGASASAAAAADDSHPVAWGYNEFGQLGDTTTTDRHSPAAVEGLTGVQALSLGIWSSLALLDNGTVRAWGNNQAGQLGDGTTANHPVPGAVVGLQKVRAIAAGGFHSLALLDNGKVMAWGDNSRGQLGIGTNGGIQRIPVEIVGLDNVKAISAGFLFSLALLDNGKVMAWGENGLGQLGIGTSDGFSDNPIEVANLSGVRAIAAGNSHSLALLENRRVKAWGANFDGQLGDGSTSERDTPVDVTGLTDVREVAAGLAFSLARRANGRVKSWGDNEQGQLGIGVTGGDRTTPVDVVNLTGVRAIAAGAEFALALLEADDDIVASWGLNGLGQLGDGTTTTRNRPIIVQTTLDNVSSIEAGGLHVVAAG
ncbi:RCC1 domain-containing protein [Catellatospora tritici]|uniref:RCC1 domain-containing protein n=1 Tax=Catellatospora tritici TaxID=2851566 RepID=UPI001C2CF483|nr:RCC1 domain-containing protein [Catellatospora tritici]MBV1849278.1 cell wall anchor protein [Catellatospora tritici]